MLIKQKNQIIPLAFQLLLAIITQAQNNNNNYLRYSLADNTDSKCLDGSNGFYYFSNHSSQINSTKFILSFTSDGWCGHEGMDLLNSCYQKSTINWSTKLPFIISRVGANGIYSGNMNNNPYMYDWNSVIFANCDGTLDQGYSHEPVIYKGKNLWIRGINTTQNVLNELILKHNLGQATEVLIAGCSTGGLIALAWSNYIKSILPASAKVWVLMDSSFYLDIKSTNGQFVFRDKIKNLFNYADKEVDPINQKCVQLNPNEKWKCLMAEYLIDYVDVPVFLSQFDYDWWHIQHIYGSSCSNSLKGYGNCYSCSPKENDQLEMWKNQYTEKIESKLTKEKGHYYWRLPCNQHCMIEYDYSFNNNNFQYKNMTIAQALFKWMYNLL